MNKNTISFTDAQAVMNSKLDELVRQAAQKMIMTAVEAECEEFLQRHKGLTTSDKKQAVVRNGYHNKRQLTVNAGTVKIKIPRTRNRNNGENFNSKLIPKYKRRSITIDEAIPILYLKGLSNNDIAPAMKSLFGNAVKGLSSGTVTRLKKDWLQEQRKWHKRSLSNKKYCYVWVDGIHFNLRLDESRLCVLVVMGATAEGKKELIAVEGGYRESSESWAVLLRDLRDRGMQSPKLFIGDGALGFWRAVRNVFPEADHQRCWVHKTANILDKMPKKIQPKAKNMIHEIYQSETKKDALTAYKKFIQTYEAKYPRAVVCLTKDKDSLFSFYDFPAEHWQHIRSTNAIESSFATVRLRTSKTRGQGSLEMTLAMVYKLLDEASKRWRKLRGAKLVSLVIDGKKFTDGNLKEDCDIEQTG